MRRYLYSNLLKIIFDSVFVIVSMPSAIVFICSLLIDKRFNATSLLLILSCFLSWLLLMLVTFILNMRANNCILFEEGKMLYNNRTTFCDEVSLKYFKFHISFIEPSLVIPKLHINGNNFSITCYHSKRDIEKIKKMKFEIKEV